MKFPRNVRILRSQFDVAPFAAVFFLLAIFLTLTAFVPVPGVPLQLPRSGDLPGTDKPTVAVAIDSDGRFYFANQLVSETQLKTALREKVLRARAPLTLVIHADKSVTYGQLMRLVLLARDPGVGITNALLATLPRVLDEPLAP